MLTPPLLSPSPIDAAEQLNFFLGTLFQKCAEEGTRATGGDDDSNGDDSDGNVSFFSTQELVETGEVHLASDLRLRTDKCSSGDLDASFNYEHDYNVILSDVTIAWKWSVPKSDDALIRHGLLMESNNNNSFGQCTELIIKIGHIHGQVQAQAMPIPAKKMQDEDIGERREEEEEKALPVLSSSSSQTTSSNSKTKKSDQNLKMDILSSEFDKAKKVIDHEEMEFSSRLWVENMISKTEIQIDAANIHFSDSDGDSDDNSAVISQQEVFKICSDLLTKGIWGQYSMPIGTHMDMDLDLDLDVSPPCCESSLQDQNQKEENEFRTDIDTLENAVSIDEMSMVVDKEMDSATPTTTNVCNTASFQLIIVKKMIVSHHRGGSTSMRWNFKNLVYVGRVHQWAIDEITVKIPLFAGLQIIGKASGIGITASTLTRSDSGSRSYDSNSHASTEPSDDNISSTEDKDTSTNYLFPALDITINKLSSFRIDGVGWNKHLKYILKDSFLHFDGTKLNIKLTSRVVFFDIGSQDTLLEADPIHFRAAFPINIVAPSVQYMKTRGEEDGLVEHLAMDQVHIVISPSYMGDDSIEYTPISCRGVKQFTVNGCLILKDVSISSRIDASLQEFHATSVDIGSLGFHCTEDTVKWLADAVKYLDGSVIRTESEYKLPHIEIASFNSFLYPVALMSILDANDFQYEPYTGESSAALQDVLWELSKILLDQVNDRRKRSKSTRAEAADSVAITAGAALLGASMSTPAGALASIAALGVRDGIGSAVISGKSSRGVTEHDSYKFGDVTRGIIHGIGNTVSSGKEARGGTKDNNYQFGDFTRGISAKIKSGPSEENSGDQSSESDRNFILNDDKRLAGVGGLAAGAAVGAVVLGPVGVLAGSMIGTRMAKARVESNTQDDKCLPLSIEEEQRGKRYQFGDGTRNTIALGKNARGATKDDAYQFGDVTRGVLSGIRDTVSSGKETRGADKEGNYQFGDFTRGLLRKTRRSNNRSK